MIRSQLAFNCANLKIPPLLPLLAALAIFNAMLPAAFEHIRLGGFLDSLQQGFGQSFVIWLSIAVAVRLYQHSEIDHSTPPTKVLAVAFLLSLLLSIPLATLSWCIAAMLSLLWRNFNRHDAYSRAVAILICAIALREPISRLCLTLFSSEILSFDASIAALLLELSNQQFVVENNVISQPNGYSLLILTGCSAFGNLSLSLLLWLALTLMLHQRIQTRDLLRIGLVAMIVIGLNALRLALMALGPDSYDLLHQGMGADVYEGLGLLCTLLCVRWRNRHEETASDITDSATRSDSGTGRSNL